MFFILTLFYGVFCLWPNTLTDMDCLKGYFHSCSYAGKNNENLLFECFGQILLIPIKSLTQNENIKIQIGFGMNRWLHDQLFFYHYGGVLSIEINSGNQTKPFHMLYGVQNFASFRIDAQLMVITTLKINNEQTYFLSLLFIEPYQEHIYEEFQLEGKEYDFNKNIHYYDSIRKSLVIAVKDSQGILLIEFSLVNRIFRILEHLHANIVQYFLTGQGVMLLQEITQNKQTITVYYIDQELKLRQIDNFDFSVYQLFNIVENLSGQQIQYVILQSNNTYICEIKKNGSKLVVQLVQFDYYLNNTLGHFYFKHSFFIEDKILVISSSFMRTVLTKQSSYDIGCQTECQCQEINLIQGLQEFKDLKEFNKIYNYNSKKGDTFKWLHHPELMTKQLMKITGSIDFNQTIQRMYTIQGDSFGEFIFNLNQARILHENTSFYHELILLSDMKVTDLVFSLSEYHEWSYYLYYDIATGLICFLFWICFIIAIKHARIRWKKRQIEKKYLTEFPFSSSLVVFGEIECSICLGVFQEKQKVCQPLCGHTFHLKCFQDWMQLCQSGVKCPACNQKLDDIQYKERDLFF